MSKHWTRATPRNRCKVCGKDSWCTWRERDDGTTYVLCMREEAGSIKASNLASSSTLAYHHILDGSGGSSTVGRAAPLPNVDLAPVQRRHEVYRELLSIGLTPFHESYLRRRGFDERDLARLSYASTVEGEARFRLVESLASRYDLRGVPGFFFAKDQWHLSATPGILLPVRDPHGLITGCQINTDAAVFAYMRYTAAGLAVPGALDVGAKYVWLSSAPYEDKDPNTGRLFIRRKTGVAAAAQPHFNPIKTDPLTALDEVIVVEGVMKCDRVALYTDVTVVGTPGVGVGAVAVANFCTGVRRVKIAYDMDWRTNPHVKGALTGLLELLRDKRGLDQVSVVTWPELFKGYDDFLDGGATADQQSLPATEWLAAEKQHGI